MSEHLPECFEAWQIARKCNICDALRACEERVARAFHVVRRDDVAEWEKLSLDNFDAGYADGLNAAREAVAALATERELRSPSGLEVDVRAALSAIDALRKERNE